MGLFRGSVTLTRYQVVGNLPSSLADFLDQRIRRFAFRSIEDGTEELAVGWVSVHDYLDTEFAYGGYHLDPYIVLGMRIDRRRLPAALVKKYHRLEIQKALASLPPGEKLGRSRREELKEKTRLDLLRRLPPATQAVDVCWDTNRRRLWLGSATGSVRELFEELFQRTFELTLRPLIPWLLARELVGPKGLEPLEAARPLALYREEG